MITVIPFQPAHVLAMQVQPAQMAVIPTLAEYADTAGIGGPAWTVLYDGVILCCGGMIEIWQGRWQGWTLLSADCGRHMLALTRTVRRLFSGVDPRRLEAYVYTDFEPGHRWMRALGFKPEGIMYGFGEDGGDMVMYARLR